MSDAPEITGAGHWGRIALILNSSLLYGLGAKIVDELFERLLKPRSLFAGWHLTRRDVLRDFYLDDFGLECFATNLRSHIADVSRALRLGELNRTGFSGGRFV